LPSRSLNPCRQHVSAPQIRLRQRRLAQLPDNTRHGTSHSQQSNPKEDQTVRPGRLPKTEYHRADILPSQGLEACRDAIRQAHDKLRRNVLHRSYRHMVDQLSLELRARVSNRTRFPMGRCQNKDRRATPVCISTRLFPPCLAPAVIAGLLRASTRWCSVLLRCAVEQ